MEETQTKPKKVKIIRGAWVNGVVKPLKTIEAKLIQRDMRRHTLKQNQEEVEGVSYRTSPTTGLKRAIKPKCKR